MGLGDEELLKGRLTAGPLVNIAAATATNAQVIFVRSTGFQGTWSFKIRKIAWNDNGTGGTLIHIGTGFGGSFVPMMVPIKTTTLDDGNMDKDDIPALEFFADATAYVDAVGASSVDLQVEVEELGA